MTSGSWPAFLGCGETRVLRNAGLSASRLFTVEVSGWDRSEKFFVERCELEWNEESRKHVALTRALSENTLLLVRLMQAGEAGRPHPVVYEAELVGKTESGLQQFRLNPVAPS
jgi:hypothetical protein